MIDDEVHGTLHERMSSVPIKRIGQESRKHYYISGTYHGIAYMSIIQGVFNVNTGCMHGCNRCGLEMAGDNSGSDNQTSTGNVLSFGGSQADQVVSDNGPQFASMEFKQFCNIATAAHVRSTPVPCIYHPKTNALAERAVRTFKERVTMSRQHKKDLELRVQKFLIS